MKDKTENNYEKGQEILHPLRKVSQERRHKSLVWDYFEKMNATRVRCSLCALEQSYQGNTWNILRHLKSIHKIDATKRGNSLNGNLNECGQQQQQQQEVMAKKIKQQHSTDDEAQLRSHISSDEYKLETFPDSEPLIDFAMSDMNFLCRDKKDLPVQYFERRQFSSNRGGSSNSLENDRIIAETEYFREKAAYFRVQKHLAALQAKKVQFELDQLYIAHNVANYN